jgi:hypothetical protein
MPEDVRAFFRSLTQVALLTAAMIVLLFVGIRPDPSHYFAGSLRQIELLENVPSPRIILIGGSNVSFGLDAELMQKTLGIPVINDGLHAGLGVVPLTELQEYIREGDVIIVSLEYSMFSSKDIMEGDRAFLSDWIEYSPRRLKYLSNPLSETPGIYATMLQRKVNRKVNSYLLGGSLDETRGVFSGTKFDTEGDFIGHLDEASMSRKKILSVPYPVSGLKDDIFIFLQNFNQIALENGAEVYFEAPASRRSNCKATGETSIANFFKTFAERTSIPMLTSLEEVCMPDKYFFDTAYHLNAQGRELRTKRLIANWIKLTTASK